MVLFNRVLAALAAAAVFAGGVQSASAACTRLAFSVNDYGKDGPTKDAKNLLDKYIAKWAQDRNIKGYNVGPKDVTCELFLDFIVFDEYTCKAAATVCWNGPLPPGHTVDASANPPTLNKAAEKKAAGTAPTARAPAPAAPIATGSVKAAPAAAKAPAAAAPATAPAASAPAAAPAVVAPAAAPAAN